MDKKKIENYLIVTDDEKIQFKNQLVINKFPLEINKISNAETKAKEILERFGLSERFYNLPSQLSGGEQQRVAIARSIVMKPKLILADEPTGNLDSENSNLISKILFDYVKEENSSLIMVTHDQNLANQTNRKIKIKDGRID